METRSDQTLGVPVAMHSRTPRTMRFTLLHSSSSSSSSLMLLAFLFLCSMSLLLSPVHGAPNRDLYCGAKNCYEILSLSSEATPSEVKKSFYRLSLQFHPDKNSAAEAVEIFRDITTAYEVLSDAESRKDYDEALLHPERFFQNQMRYYQHQYRHAQQVDAWKVLLLTLILVSLAHFYYWRHRHAKVIQMIAAAPLVVQRMRAKVKTDILEAKAKAGMKNPSASKEEIDAAVQLEDVRNYAELTSWEGRAPTLWDTVPVWLAVAPFRLAKFLYWHARFLTLFTILGREYGPEEADYATCVALGMDYNKWSSAVPADKRAELTARKLWIPKQFEAWKREMTVSKKKTW